MELDRTRIIFLAILGVTAVVICGALAFNFYNNQVNQPSPTPAAEVTATDAVRPE